MKAEAINANTDKEDSQSKPFNFSLDAKIRMQMAIMSGLGGILYYLLSCTCPA